MTDTNQTWLALLGALSTNGSRINPRGNPSVELIGTQTQIDMNAPVVTIKERALGYRFMAAEAAWIIRGDNRVETIGPYAAHIKAFSDDGVYYQGAYGPMVIDQISYVASKLNEDPSSRQAILTIWRPNPRPSKDIPCTIAIQWFIRDGMLHCIDTMRSSDVWLGYPYDIVNFSCLSWYLRALLREVYGIVVDMGSLMLQAGSQHYYERNEEAITAILSGCSSLDQNPRLNERWDLATPQRIIADIELAKDQPLGFLELANMSSNAV